MKKEKSKISKGTNLEAKIYDQKGKEGGTINLSEQIFNQNWNADLVHQVVTSMLSSRRDNIAHTKTRGEVRGGGKKPWKQKGTGRARHGSSRSPIWVGGGVAHGPRNDKNFDRKVNRKAKAKALACILSAKWREGEILFVSELDFKTPKASDARDMISALGLVKGYETLSTKRKNAAWILTLAKEKALEKSFANSEAIVVSELRNINPADILKVKYLIIDKPEGALKLLEEKFKS